MTSRSSAPCWPGKCLHSSSLGMACASGTPMGTYGQSNLQYPRVPCSPMHDFCPWGVKVTGAPYFCSELVYFQLSSNASYCAFSSFIKVLCGNYLQQCWQLKHFENYYFTWKKKERSVRDRRIQQSETREKRNWNGHWCWDTAENSSQAPEKGQKNKAVFPLLCTPDLPCHQKQLMALFINSHKPHLFFSLVKILKYRFLPVSESQLRADSYRPSPWNYQNGCCQFMANVISTYLLYCI